MYSCIPPPGNETPWILMNIVQGHKKRCSVYSSTSKDVQSGSFYSAPIWLGPILPYWSSFLHKQSWAWWKYWECYCVSYEYWRKWVAGLKLIFKVAYTFLLRKMWEFFQIIFTHLFGLLLWGLLKKFMYIHVIPRKF